MKEIIKYNLNEIALEEAWSRALKILPLLTWRKNIFDIFWRKDDEDDKHYMTIDTRHLYLPKSETTCISFGLAGSDEILACIKREDHYINLYVK